MHTHTHTHSLSLSLRKHWRKVRRIEKTNVNNRSLNQAPFYKLFHPYTLVISFENFWQLSCSGGSSAVPNDRGFLSASELEGLLEMTSFQSTHAYQHFLQQGTIPPVVLLPSQFSSKYQVFSSLGELQFIVGNCLVFIGKFSLHFFLTNLFIAVICFAILET